MKDEERSCFLSPIEPPP